MAELSPENVTRLLEQVRRHREAQALADAERGVLDVALLDVAKQSRVGLRELAAVTGMHPNTIRASIQRAAGPATIDFEQPELDLMALSEPTTAERVAAPSQGQGAMPPELVQETGRPPAPGGRFET